MDHAITRGLVVVDPSGAFHEINYHFVRDTNDSILFDFSRLQFLDGLIRKNLKGLKDTGFIFRICRHQEVDIDGCSREPRQNDREPPPITI